MQEVQEYTIRERAVWAEAILTSIPDADLLPQRKVPDEHRYSADDGPIREHDPLVLEMVNSGSSVNRAIKDAGMPRSSFYKYRYMAEMKIVDLAHYLYLKDQFRYVQQLSKECKEALSEDGNFGRQAEQMMRSKQLLPHN